MRVGKVCGFGLRFLHKERAHLFSLSLLLSSGICLALRGGERPQRERERETEERLCTRANSFSLFLFGARFLSRRSGFPTGEGSRKRRGDKERERERFHRERERSKESEVWPRRFRRRVGGVVIISEDLLRQHSERRFQKCPSSCVSCYFWRISSPERSRGSSKSNSKNTSFKPGRIGWIIIAMV